MVSLSRFLLVGAICLLPFWATGQQVKYVDLKNEKAKYATRQFYVFDVVDDREVKNIGLKDNDPVEFRNGAASCIHQFIANNFVQNRSSQPITLHITKLNFSTNRNITIKPFSSQQEVISAISIAFYAGDKKLLEYTGSGKAHIVEFADGIDVLTRKAIEDDLKQFDGWWAQNKGKVSTSSVVKVDVVLGKNIDRPACIPYSLTRLLQIPDFAGAIENLPTEAAATVSGVAIGFSSETRNSEFLLHVHITPFFNKAQSWFKKGTQDVRVLAHEQTHFDITAIKACELANAIRSADLSKDNYTSVIEEMYKKYVAAANQEENTYDDDTNHGTIIAKQEEWQKKLRQQIVKCGCY